MSEAKHSPLPCPCCSSDCVMEWTNQQAVKCLDCGMNGPSKSWNTRASAVTEPVAWQRRNIGKDGQPWSIWYTTNSGPSPEKCAWDGVYSYEYRALYAHPAPAAPAPADQVKCGPIGEDEWKDQRIASLEAYVAQLKDQVGAPVPASVREALEYAREYIAQDHSDFEEGSGYKKITGDILDQIAAALASPPAPAAAPTREEIAESAALSTWERIIRQFFADGRGRVSAEKALDAILALKAAPAK